MPSATDAHGGPSVVTGPAFESQPTADQKYSGKNKFQKVPKSKTQICHTGNNFHSPYIVLFFFFFKSLLNLLQHYFCFLFVFFGLEACGILVPDQGLNPHALHWKAKS